MSHSLSDMHMISILFYAADVSLTMGARRGPHTHTRQRHRPLALRPGWTLYTDTINSQRLEYSYASHAGVARGGIYLAGE